MPCCAALPVVTMRNVFLMALIGLAALVRAQPDNVDCENAALLCAQQVLPAGNVGAGGVPGFCPATDAMVWFTFTTNSLGGVVTVTVEALDCTTAAGMDNELSAVVLSGDGSCELASFNAVGSCSLSSTNFELTTPALLPQTQYWLLIAGAVNNGALQPAQCEFDLILSGPGADIVGVDVSAGPDVTIGQGESTQLQGVGGSFFDWSPTAGLSGNGIPDPIAAPSGTTRYTLATEVNGCAYTDEVIVEIVRLVNPPNTFSPNGDGYNDTWAIPGIADYPGAEVVIHDRWGQIVLRSTGYREAWDGTNDGRALSVGTYYYHIQLNQLEGRSPPYTGFVTIVR